MSDPFSKLVQDRIEPTGQVNGPIQQRKELAKNIINNSANTALSIVNMMNALMGEFWGSKEPQKMCDAIDVEGGVGTAKRIFELHKKLAVLVSTEVPPLAKAIHGVPPGYTVSFNDDNTVTITEE